MLHIDLSKLWHWLNLAAADFAVFSHKADGFSVTVSEALLTGRKVHLGLANGVSWTVFHFKFLKTDFSEILKLNQNNGWDSLAAQTPGHLRPDGL